jgi:hypothetical protein
VGFYGGINYGFGYVGEGYEGGYWHGRQFFYNRTVNNVTITNVHIYNRTVIEHDRFNRVAFNGGRGGIDRRPSRDDERFMHERHFEATHMQMEHEHGARDNREFRASVNHGRPAIAATARPGEFRGHDVVAARPGRDDRRMDNRAVDRRMDNRAMDRRMDNRNMNHEAPRPVDNRAMNRGADRSQDHGRMDRQMPRDNASNNRGGQPHNNVRMANPAPEHHGPATHPTAFHQENNRPHDSAPRPQNEGRGPKNR